MVSEMKYCVVCLLFVCQMTYAVNYTVVLGDASVLIKYQWGKGKTFVHLHQNEHTALKAARVVIKKEGGSLLTLMHSGQRNIVFHLKNKRYEFDPNRIFTDQGIKKTLMQFGPYSPLAHKEVKKLALKIQTLLPDGKVVAVHNNATYSLKDYLPGHALANDAKALHLSPKNYFRNFYLVTKIKDYYRLKSKGFNGILQKKGAVDDGSLSILLASKQYVNVEAGYDQLSEQIKMLQHA